MSSSVNFRRSRKNSECISDVRHRNFLVLKTVPELCFFRGALRRAHLRRVVLKKRRRGWIQQRRGTAEQHLESFRWRRRPTERGKLSASSVTQTISGGIPARVRRLRRRSRSRCRCHCRRRGAARAGTGALRAGAGASREGAPSAELAAPAAAAVGRLPRIQHPPKRPSKRNFRSTDPALPLLVAFGDGRACSSGLGYCPAPQGRLRRHLARKHHAHVCLIGEYRTSMTCSCCGNVLQPVHRCKTNGRVRRPRNEKSVLWAVKKCLQCRDALPALARGGLERWRRPQDPALVLERHMHLPTSRRVTARRFFYSWNYQSS